MRELAEELLDFVDDVVDDLGSRERWLQSNASCAKVPAPSANYAYAETGDLKAVVRHIVEETRGEELEAGIVRGALSRWRIKDSSLGGAATRGQNESQRSKHDENRNSLRPRIQLPARHLSRR